jgi:peptidoglycan-associated lipoprotein
MAQPAHAQFPEAREHDDLRGGTDRAPSARVTVSRVIGLVLLTAGVTLTGAESLRPVGPSVATGGAALAPTPTADKLIGLPPVRDYQSVKALRDIHFDFGKAAIRRDDEEILDANAAWLRANPAYLLLIEGHADTRGVTDRKNELNMDLAERRAHAAMTYLVARGLHPGRITILSYGEERPQCPEETERCWRENRRARFLVKPR